MTAPLGVYHVYADAPGMVVRCPTCEVACGSLRRLATRGWT